MATVGFKGLKYPGFVNY